MALIASVIYTCKELKAGAEIDHLSWFDVGQLPLEQMLLCDKEFALFLECKVLSLGFY